LLNLWYSKSQVPLLYPQNGNLMTDYLGQIVSEIQTEVYNKNDIFVANECCNQWKTMATVYTPCSI